MNGIDKLPNEWQRNEFEKWMIGLLMSPVKPDAALGTRMPPSLWLVMEPVVVLSRLRSNNLESERREKKKKSRRKNSDEELQLFEQVLREKLQSIVEDYHVIPLGMWMRVGLGAKYDLVFILDQNRWFKFELVLRNKTFIVALFNEKDRNTDVNPEATNRQHLFAERFFKIIEEVLGGSNK